MGVLHNPHYSPWPRYFPGTPTFGIIVDPLAHPESMPVRFHHIGGPVGCLGSLDDLVGEGE